MNNPEPTEQCPYCEWGSLLPRNSKDTSKQIPCPACNGKTPYFARNLRLTDVRPWVLDPDTFGPRRKIVFEFDHYVEAQQDGREPPKGWADAEMALEIGKQAVAAIKKRSQE